MADDSRHLWQRLIVVICRDAAATVFAVGLIRAAGALSNWQAIFGFVLIAIAFFDLGIKLLDLKGERERQYRRRSDEVGEG